jgi:hypothetical protein
VLADDFQLATETPWLRSRWCSYALGGDRMPKALPTIRGQLLVLWLLLALSAMVTGYLFLQFYSQTAARQVSEAEEIAGRACRTIGDRYRSYMVFLSSGLRWVIASRSRNSDSSRPVCSSTLCRQARAREGSSLANGPKAPGAKFHARVNRVSLKFPPRWSKISLDPQGQGMVLRSAFLSTG